MTISTFSKRFTAAMAFAAAAMASGTASAESIAIEQMTPASNANAAQVNSIVIERFDGREGSAMSIAVENALRGANIDGRPYFQLFREGSGADAIMSGTARVSYNESTEFQVREKCLKYDLAEKCIELEEYKVSCTRTTVALRSSVSLSAAIDGRSLYGSTKSEQDQHLSCTDQNNENIPDDMVPALIDRAAASIRADMAPRQSVMNIDIQEKNSGVPRANRKAFKAAIKLTKNDDSAACAAFETLYQQASGARSLIYNAALCAERDGNFDRATELLQIAEPMYKLSYSAERGLSRVAQSQAARSQIDARPAPQN